MKKSALKGNLWRWRDSFESLALPRTVFRVVVLGSGGVGKTSLITQFTSDTFTEEYHPTVEDLYESPLNLTPKITALFDIVDTAGSYNFPAMRKLTIDEGEAFVLVYSVDDQNSLEEVLKIRGEILEAKGSNSVPMILVANKCDIPEEDRQLSVEKISEALIEAGVDCLSIAASAKYDLNVNATFKALLADIAFGHGGVLPGMSGGTKSTKRSDSLSASESHSPFTWLKSHILKERIQT